MVDDAIVVGETSIPVGSKAKAVCKFTAGAKEVAAPVFRSTTIIAFTPMFFGNDGFAKVAATIPAVVILVLIISLVESFFILPAHLAHSAQRSKWIWMQKLEVRQARIGKALERFNREKYRPILEKTLRWRYLCLVVSLVFFALAASTIKSGWMPVNVFPDIDADWVVDAKFISAARPAKPNA